MTTAPRRQTVVLALGLLLVLAGCTTSDSAAPQDRESAVTTAPAARETGSATPGDDRSSAGADEGAGPSPEELSQQVLDAAAARAVSEPVATQTIDSDGAQLTLGLVAVTRTLDGTLAEFRLSSATDGVPAGIGLFEEDALGTVSFIRGVFLEDTGAGVRYRPLVYEDERSGVGCVCPYKPLTLGPEPQTVYALFPPLPEGVTAVDFRTHQGFLVADVQVQAGS